MTQQTMYLGQVNSRQTQISVAINSSVTTISVADASILPAAPNLATLGNDESAETILYNGKSGNNLTGCTRGFQGTAASWGVGVAVGRMFTSYDYDTLVNNFLAHAGNHITGGLDVIPNAAAGGNSGLMSGTDKLNQDSTLDFLFNNNIGFKRWRSKIARVRSGVGNQIARVSILGDSITEGYGSGGGSVQGAAALAPAKGYVRRIQDALSSKYGDVGLGFIPVTYPFNAPIWSLSGTWINETGFGTANLCKSTAINASTATFSFNGTGVGIVYVKGSTSGTFTYSIDGRTPVSVNGFNATTIDNAILEITGLTQGDHTLVLTNTSSNKLILIGGYSIKGSTGVLVNMCGRATTTVADHALTSSLDVTINSLNPDLVIISLTSNDYLNQTSIVSYKSSLQTIITRALTYGDVLLISSGLQTGSGTIPQSQYVQAMKDLAILNNVAFYDLFTRWGADGNYLNTTLGLIWDYTHPNDFGYEDMATTLLTTIDDYWEDQTAKAYADNMLNGIMGQVVFPLPLASSTLVVTAPFQLVVTNNGSFVYR